MTSPGASLAATAVVGALAAVAGLSFAPVFGAVALAIPVGVPVSAVVLAALGCRRPALQPWRPLVTFVSGVLAVVETTLWETTANGLPTGETAAAFQRGVATSWQQVLQSTWPARAEPDTMLFVPLLAVFAAVLGVELVHRARFTLVAVVPSLLLLVVAQVYVAASGWFAVTVGAGYLALVGALFGRRRTSGGGRLAVAGVGLVGVATMVVVTVAVPVPSARYSLRDDHSVPLVDLTVASPLDRLSARLAEPDTPLFRLRGDVAGHWPLVVLDTFDGVTWQPGTRYRRLGSELPPGPEVRVPVRERTTRVELLDLEPPWLPGRTWPSRVDGVAPLVEERHRSLLVPEERSPLTYTLTWWDPEVTARALADAPVDADAPGGLAAIGSVPPGVAELAERAAGEGRPTFRTAVRLEQYLREHYTIAPATEVASGHSWPHLERFLLTERRGTSEQFAAAYVALARARGIPARLVVGFTVEEHTDDYTVRNADAEAWPEVAVEGVGWVPLDPTGVVSGRDSRGDGLTAVTDRARGVLDERDPAPEPPEGEDESPPARAAEDDPSIHLPLWLFAAILPLAVVSWCGAVVVGRMVRTQRRRRRTGAAGVLAAWAEAHDRLRVHGVVTSPAMTPREVAVAAADVVDQDTVAAVRALASEVDLAAWSGPTALRAADRDRAWAAVGTIRRGLARRGWRARLCAMFGHRGRR